MSASPFLHRWVGFALALTSILPSVRAVLGDAIPVHVYVIPPAILMIVLVMRRLVDQPLESSRPTLMLAATFTLWVGWMVLASAWSPSHLQYREDLILLVLMLTYGVLTSVTVTLDAVEHMVSWIIGASVLIAFFVLAQYALLGDLSGYTSIVYDYYLTISLPLALGCVGAGLRSFRPGRSAVWWALLAAFLLSALGLSLARGVLVFVGLILVVVLPSIGLERIASARKRADVRYGYAAVLAPILLSAMMLSTAWTIERTRVRLVRMFSGEELSRGGRGELWSNALDGIRDAPWFGHGLGSSGLAISGVEGQYPHNIVLQSWLDGGIPAAILIGAVLALPFVFALYGVCSGRARLTGAWVVPMSMLAILVLEHLKSEHAYTARSLVVMAFGATAALTSDVRRRPDPEAPS